MKLFYDFNSQTKISFQTLQKIINPKSKITIIKIPEKLEQIKKITLTSFSELKEEYLKKLGKVILEFEPIGILKINKDIINCDLDKIFFKIGSEHEFSCYTDELTPEEYDEIINFLTEDRLKLNMEAEECARVLLLYSKIIEFEIKVPKKYKDTVTDIGSEKIEELSKLIPKLKEKKKDYTQKMKEYLKKILEEKRDEIPFKAINFVIKFDLFIFYKNNIMEKLFFNLYDNYHLESKNDNDKISMIESFIYNIQDISEKRIIQFLCNDKNDFKVKNIYEKLKNYNNAIDLFTNVIPRDGKTIKFIDYSSDQKNNRIFLQYISSKDLKNFLKLFLFCCRDEILITQEQIKKIFDIYSKFKNKEIEIEKNLPSNLEKKKILFDKKIEFLLIMFEEKLKNLRINGKSLKEYKEIREMSYKKIREKYINNILKTKYDLEKETKNQTYVDKISQNNQDIAWRKIKKFLEKKKNKTKEEEELYDFFKFWNEQQEEKIKRKAGRKIENKELFSDNILENIRDFCFSNIGRVGIYYKILLLNILFDINKEDFAEEAQIMKETSEDSKKNFQIYYNALMRNNKQFGDKHLKYLFYYLVKKESKLIFNIINYLNFLHLYDNNLLENTINLKSFETFFPFYEKMTLEEINLK